MANRMSDANAGAEYGKMLADSRAGGRVLDALRRRTSDQVPVFAPVLRRHNAAELAAAAGSYGRHAEPLDQRAREDRYRKQTGRLNRLDPADENTLEWFPPHQRARALGLTPKQRRRSEHKERRADARLIPGGGRR